MGLFSKSQDSKKEAVSSTTSVDPKNTDDASSIAEFPKGSRPTSASNSTAPPPGYESHKKTPWPLVPFSSGYKEGVAQIAEGENTMGEPRKKSWFKKTFNLADPSDSDYYERRYTASGEGSDYEKIQRIAGLNTGGVLFTPNGKILP